MKLTIAKQQLNDAIQHVSKAISSRTTLPILAGIKLEADENGLSLTASDTDLSIRSFIPKEIEDEWIIELEQPGSIVLPAKFFVEIIRKLPQDNVHIDVSDNYHAMIRSGDTEIQMVGLDPEEFPVLPVLDESRTFAIQSSKLKMLIRQTVFAVSTNESTPVLTGVLWTLENGILKFVSTDRHRLANRKITLDIDTELEFKNIVIPGKTLNELNKIIPDQDTTIDIVIADNQVLFKLDSLLFYSRILDGTYPDTSRIIPEQYKTELVVDTNRLLDALERAHLLSREEKTNIVNMSSNQDGSLEISSSLSELGRIREQCPVHEQSGDLLKIAFNAKYMLDALKVIDSDHVHFGFNGPMSPIVIRPQDQDHMLQLVLPYRTIS